MQHMLDLCIVDAVCHRVAVTQLLLVCLPQYLGTQLLSSKLVLVTELMTGGDLHTAIRIQGKSRIGWMAR